MKNVTLRQIKVFEAVAHHSSYTRAADELYLTQPAVSMQIKQLEENLEVALFEQIGKRIYLTEAGREFHRYSSHIVQQLSEAETVLEELKGVQRGNLNISVVSTAKYFAPRLLAIFSRRFQDVTVSLDVTNRERVLRQLTANEKDIAIMGIPPLDQDLVAAPFTENPLVIVAPPDHPLTAEKNIPLERLQKEIFLMREPGSGTRSAMERFFEERDIHISSSMMMNSNEAIKQAVQAGLGLGIVSVHTVVLELEVQRLAILDVEHLPIMRHWYLVHRQGKRLSPLSQAFKEFILGEAHGIMENIRKNRDIPTTADMRAAVGK